MEMMAVICGLEKLIEPCQVSLYSDSIYVLKGMQEWMPKWKVQGWQRRGVKNKKEPVKNIELWKKLDELKEIHEISYHKVKGHSGHPENERCDFLAVEACAKAREDNRCND
jgi:ribonuclease HI